MNLRGVMETSADADLPGKTTGFAAERLMELEVGALTGAAQGEARAERLVQPNSYPDRNRQGTMHVLGVTISCRPHAVGPMSWVV